MSKETHEEFMNRVAEESREPTIAERTHNALSETESFSAGEHIKVFNKCKKDKMRINDVLSEVNEVKDV